MINEAGPVTRGKPRPEKAAQEYTIPGTLRRRVAVETLRGWLRAYRRGGFEALVPRQRADLGSARALPPAVVDLLCELKDNEPKLTLTALVKKARAEHPALVTDEVRIAESTVHRLLARRGLMKKRPDEPTAKDRRRFEHESAEDLWMSDVMHGPKVKDGTRRAGRSRCRESRVIPSRRSPSCLLPFAAWPFSPPAFREPRHRTQNSRQARRVPHCTSLAARLRKPCAPHALARSIVVTAP